MSPNVMDSGRNVEDIYSDHFINYGALQIMVVSVLVVEALMFSLPQSNNTIQQSRLVFVQGLFCLVIRGINTNQVTSDRLI